MNTSILGAIREFIAYCPALKGGNIHVNFLPNEPVEYSIEDVPGTAIVKRYVNGATVRQALFLIASRQFYSRGIIENLKASGIYEQISDWLEIQTAKGNFPELPAGDIAQKIEALTNGYCITADIEQSVQQYQIQCRLLYFKEAV